MWSIRLNTASVLRRAGDEYLPHPHHQTPAADDQHGKDRGHEDGEEDPGAPLLELALLFVRRRRRRSVVEDDLHWFAMAGKRWAMPLWQSMQVLPPSETLAASAVEWASAARLDWRVKSIDWNSWQLRHSRESLAFMRSHSRPASSWRLARNSSRVSMVPKIQPHTSFEACILRAILWVQSFGTWQSEHLARTPERLVKWMVGWISWYTLSRISWQPMQNCSVLVSSIAVLNPPQKITPAAKPLTRRKPRL